MSFGKLARLFALRALWTFCVAKHANGLHTMGWFFYMYVVLVTRLWMCMFWMCSAMSTCVDFLFMNFRIYVCRVEDYWQGYKLFCYAYYSHSLQHESEFSNPNWVRAFAPLFVFLWLFIGFSSLSKLLWIDVVCGFWNPSLWLYLCRAACVATSWWVASSFHHVLRTSCMQLLPLVEMYCKWELEEDCSNLRALMLRFNSELELESHELGYSLLSMVRDDDMGLDRLPRCVRPKPQTNPFDVVKERLATVDLAIRDLQPKVHLVSDSSSWCKLAKNFVIALRMATTLFRTSNGIEFESGVNAKHLCFNFGCPNIHVFDLWVLLKFICKVTSCATMCERVAIQSSIAFKMCFISKCHMVAHSMSFPCLCWVPLGVYVAILCQLVVSYA